MIRPFKFLSLVFLFARPSFTLNITGPSGEITANSTSDIKSVAKTIASSIISTYKDYLKDGGIEGLFSDSGDPYYFWEAGAAWAALLEYSYLTGDSQFDDTVLAAVAHQVSDDQNFMPPNQTKTIGNDDQGIWGLVAMSAAEMGFKTPGGVTGSWADMAINVFNDLAARWDTQTCGGGLRWQIFPFNKGYSYKNSISTGIFFLLSSRLAVQFPKNTTYSVWAEKAFDWAQGSGLVKDFHVYDGSDVGGNCSSINHIQWTMNHATFTEGAAVMYNLTNGADKWKSAVSGFVNATSVFRVEKTDWLYEVACETSNKCSTDQRAFKGIAARSFARAAVAAPFTSSYFRPMLEISAIGATLDCDGDASEVKCGFGWDGAKDARNWTDPDAVYQLVSVKDGGLGEVLNALQVTQALLWPQAKALVSNTSGPNATATGGGGTTTTGAAKGAAGMLTVSPAVLFVTLLGALIF